MEKPDEKGFVNIKWPSKNIPYGGVFHTKVLEPCSKREAFLKVLLEESKLSIEQRRKGTWKLRQNSNHSENLEKRSPQPRTLVRPQTSRRRSLSEIRDSGALEVNSYHPLKKGEDREKLKQRLQEEMAWGDNKPKQSETMKIQLKTAPVLPTSKEIRNEILTQIRERVEWLADMEELGEGAQHRQLIQDQIVDKMRSLEALGLDSARTEASSGRNSIKTIRSNHTNNSKSSIKLPSSGKSIFASSGRKQKKNEQNEENVSAYGSVKLQYSPRRAC